MKPTLKIRWWFLTTYIFVGVAAQLSGLMVKDIRESADDATGAVLSVTSKLPPCSYVLIADSDSYDYRHLSKSLSSSTYYQGVTVFQVAEDITSSNTSTDHLIKSARKIRVSYSCVALVVLSDNLEFLLDFGKSSLANRLLTGASRLLIIGHLDPEEVDTLMSQWTFFMLNTLVVIPVAEANNERWDMYFSLPYSVSGKQIVQAGSWSSSRGLDLKNTFPLFPEKFSDFYNAAVNVTALPYKPYWTKEEETVGDTVNTLYSGADRRMLEAMASALNFTIYVLPVESWDEVIQRVSERVSFMATVVHMVLPQRLQRVDFTRTYEHGINIAFAMAKPVLKPQWESLYYPLSSQVWLCILATLLLIPVCFVGVTREISKQSQHSNNPSTGLLVLEIFGTLLGQSLNTRRSTVTSLRVLLASWLVFAFIISTAYRSNLIASLVAPRYPPRPESLDQLVKVVERVTMPSYGAEFRDFLRGSEFQSFRALGAKLQVGVSVTDGLNQALKFSQSHIDGTRYLEQQIAEHFTEANGDSRLYVGREGVLPGLNAWPIPHDAPYKKSFDAVILAIIEAGLYNKWMKDMLDQARKEGRQKRREQLKKLNQKGTEGQVIQGESSDNGDAKALTIVHLQGPLMLLAIGSGAGLVSFFVEFATNSRYVSKPQTA